MLSIVLPAVIAAAPPLVTVDHDNVAITTSCTVRIDAPRIMDADGNGVIHITADGITVDFAAATLNGAEEGQSPDTFTGIGVRITANNVTLRGARICGFQTGIYASHADGLVIEDCDVSGNFHQRLRSTPQAEDPSDWLSPHANDDNEWLANYGAGIYIEDADQVTVRRVRARHGQNGIILDRVNDSKVYDNDCSFLSGWGLAMWRSNRNVISRNAFDFCVRGYSHGVYNRGQDSAGILMFEQCSENVIAENSATHCGDGFFGFAGNEALGEVNPRDDLEWYKGRGNTHNLVAGNDFSYAAAHGIEMTFSFGNRFKGNRLFGNAICGIWAGYSQQTVIAGNEFAHNGEMGYGLERGGINIEHGFSNVIMDNEFRHNRCGVHLWWDADEQLMQLPWAQANERGSRGNILARNTFVGDDVAVQLRNTQETQMDRNVMEDVKRQLDADDQSDTFEHRFGVETVSRGHPAWGDTRPVGARKHLRGREHIIMTEWGPYDWQAPYLFLAEAEPSRHVYRLLGRDTRLDRDTVRVTGQVKVELQSDQLIVRPTKANLATPYAIVLTVAGNRLERRSVLIDTEWFIIVSGYETKPVAKPDDEGPPLSEEEIHKRYVAWRNEMNTQAVWFPAPQLNLRYGGGGPSQLNLASHVTEADLPTDHFGTIATSRLTVPSGDWRIRATSDDGIRVWLDGELVIDDWTWHPPKQHTYEFSLSEPRQMPIRVEHFELDGYAILSLDIEAVQ